MTVIKSIDIDKGDFIWIPAHLFIGKVILLSNGKKRLYLYPKQTYKNVVVMDNNILAIPD